MGSNVFGTPVTDETLKGMTEYHDKAIGRGDRARVAMEMKNAEGKDVNARKMAEYLRDRFGDSVATMGLIYNATGGTVTFEDEHDWEGHVCESPYPAVLANGQWGVFVHGKYWNGPNYSKAAVVYAGKNMYGNDKHWLLAWANNRAVEDDNNRVFTEIREPGHYASDGIISYVEQLLDLRAGSGAAKFSSHKRVAHKADDNGVLAFASIGNDKATVVEWIMTLPDALN